MVDLGRAEGRQEGRAEGLEQGRERLLLALLRARFGDSPPIRAAAQRLAHWGEAAAVEAITATTDPQ